MHQIQQLNKFIIKNINDPNFIIIFDIILRYKQGEILTSTELEIRLSYIKYVTKSLLKMGYDCPKIFQLMWFYMWVQFSMYGYHHSAIKKYTTFEILQMFRDFYVTFGNFFLIFVPLYEINYDKLVSSTIAKKMYHDDQIADNFKWGKHNEYICYDKMLPYLLLMVIISQNNTTGSSLIQSITKSYQYIIEKYNPNEQVITMLIFTIKIAFGDAIDS